MKGIKKMSFAAMAALAMVSCSNHDEWMTYEEYQAAKYDAAFVQKYGTIDPNHDWGFGGTTRVTRAAAGLWNGTHSHDWESKFVFPTQATVEGYGINLTDLGNYNDQNGNNTNAVYYVPSGKTVNLSLNGKIKFKEGMLIYNYGTITGIDANWEGKLTVYNAGTWNWTVQSGERHTIINTGTFTLANDANIGDLYNNNVIEITDSDLADAMTIYSSADGTIDVKNATSWKAGCHIDHTVNAYGKLTIQAQGSNPEKYFCGINTVYDDGIAYDVYVDGDITTSYINAKDITLNGDNIFLTADGYIKANKVSTEGNGRTALKNEYEAIVVESDSKALVDVNEFYIKNDKLGNHLGTGVYANFSIISYNEGGLKENVAVANYSDALFAQNRINNAEIGGTSTCGGTWGKVQGDEIIEQGRVFCEDLGSFGDFDFNDVVFDAYIYKSGKVEIVLQAAGGILPITVAGEDVHTHLGAGMVNTGTGPTHAPVTITTSGYATINAIPVVVSQTDNAGRNMDILLKSEIGKAPQKICVPVNTPWVKEYEDISNAYPLFKDWVGNGSTNAFVNGNENYLY